MLAEIERQLQLEDDDGRPRQERLVEKLFERALAADPDMRAMELLLKRVAPEKIAIEGEGNLLTLVLRDYTGAHHELPRAVPVNAQVEDVKTGQLLESGPVLDVESSSPDELEQVSVEI